MRYLRYGLTLVELLVAIAIFGLLLAAVTSFLSGSLRFSNVAITSADRMREINDVTSYVLDRARAASSVDVGLCGSPGRNCAAMIVPQVDTTAAGRIDGCIPLTFVAEPRNSTAVPPAFLPADPFLDANGFVIVAYIGAATPTATGACSVSASASSVSGWGGPFLVLDGLTFSDPFSVTLAGDLQISVQVANTTRTGTQRTPPGIGAADRFTATVVLRND